MVLYACAVPRCEAAECRALCGFVKDTLLAEDSSEAGGSSQKRAVKQRGSDQTRRFS